VEVIALVIVDLKRQFSRCLGYSNSYVHEPYGIAFAEFTPHVAASNGTYLTLRE